MRVRPPGQLFAALAGAFLCLSAATIARADEPVFRTPPGWRAVPAPGVGHSFILKFDGAPGAQNPSAAAPAAPSVRKKAPGDDLSASMQPPDPRALRKKLLDSLFARLKKSDDEQEAEGVAGAIERIWFDSGSDTADLLMHRALIAAAADNYAVERQILGAVVRIDPNWAEGWNELAVARALSDDNFGAMEDIAHALALEPRHFGALTGLGALLLESGDKKGALKVFRRVLELYPRLAIVKGVVRKLSIEVEGRDL